MTLRLGPVGVGVSKLLALDELSHSSVEAVDEGAFSSASRDGADGDWNDAEEEKPEGWVEDKDSDDSDDDDSERNDADSDDNSDASDEADS